MIPHETTARQYAGRLPEVPGDIRPDLWHLLTLHEPHQPLRLAAFLNGTPSLTDLEQLTDAEAAVMRDRLGGNPTYTLAAWIGHLRDAARERDGEAWLR